MPTIVRHELRKWFLRQRGEDMADRVIAFTELCVVVSLDTRLALAAAEVALGACAGDGGCHHLCERTRCRRGARHLRRAFHGFAGVILFPKG
jgi:hypothetical protein